MKVVAINGSPRKGGNTEIMLRKVLEPIGQAAIETELIQIGGENIHGCRACLQCRKNQNRRCAYDDDILNGLLERLFEADGIVLGSPTYYADMTPEMKAFIDRVGYVAGANGRLLKRKVGAAVTVSRRGGATHAFDSMNHLFQISGMIMPGSTYWNFGLAKEKGEVLKDEEAMANMQDLGETIAWLIKKLN
ncbi:flavodoxin family protein [bacterium]|nr:flavodoxin family protein [bacterium]